MSTNTHTARSAYVQVAEEFGVSEGMVRQLCGSCGRQIPFDELLSMLREKMSNLGLVAARHDRAASDDEDVIRELRTCLLCEALLSGDDPGKEVVHEETGETGVICENCAGM